MNVQKFVTEGYTVYNVLTDEESKELAQAAIVRTSDIFLQGNRNLDLLVNRQLRLETFGEEVLWKDGNSRRPRIAKNTGLVNSFLAPWTIDLHLNKKLIRNIRKLYRAGHNDEALAYTRGLERYSVKVKGSVDMPRHLDRHLYREPGGLTRVQTLVTSSIDTEINARDSGTIEVLPRFHLYWNLAGKLLQNSGLELSATIPTVLGKEFDKKLDWLNEKLEHYTRGDITSDEELENALEGLDELPICPDVFIPLKWKAIKCKPGDAISWDSRLPHHNLRNKSAIPRIAHYISLYPADEKQCTSVETGMYSGNRDNGEEIRWLGIEGLEEYQHRIQGLTPREKRLFCVS